MRCVENLLELQRDGAHGVRVVAEIPVAAGDVANLDAALGDAAPAEVGVDTPAGPGLAPAEVAAYEHQVAAVQFGGVVALVE